MQILFGELNMIYKIQQASMCNIFKTESRFIPLAQFWMQSYRWIAELELAKNLTHGALELLAQLKPSSMSLEIVPELPKEMKSEIDQISEDMILGKLLPTGFPVLSEESGVVGGNTNEGYRWIIDPLDGTVNFVRGIASCAVSIAFWQNDIPLFGVIGEFPSNKSGVGWSSDR